MSSVWALCSNSIQQYEAESINYQMIVERQRFIEIYTDSTSEIHFSFLQKQKPTITANHTHANMTTDPAANTATPTPTPTPAPQTTTEATKENIQITADAAKSAVDVVSNKVTAASTSAQSGYEIAKVAVVDTIQYINGKADEATIATTEFTIQAGQAIRNGAIAAKDFTVETAVAAKDAIVEGFQKSTSYVAEKTEQLTDATRSSFIGATESVQAASRDANNVIQKGAEEVKQFAETKIRSGSSASSDAPATAISSDPQMASAVSQLAELAKETPKVDEIVKESSGKVYDDVATKGEIKSETDVLSLKPDPVILSTLDEAKAAAQH